MATTRTLLSRAEILLVIPLAAAITLRMAGLFLMLPVLAPYVLSLPDGNLRLAGLAVGIYGLSQAALLAPLGWLSDRIGRKAVICGGLLLFAAGGFLAGAASNSAYMIVIGRALQGAGAISAAALAGIADATSPATRVQGVAIVGIGITLAFCLAVTCGGPLAAQLSVGGLLSLSGFIGLGAALMIFVLPLPKVSRSAPQHLRRPKLPPILLSLGANLFLVHAAKSALFVLLPVALASLLGNGREWLLYLPALAISLLLAAPVLMNRRYAVRRVLAICSLLLAVVLPVTGLAATAAWPLWLLILLLGCFFCFTNILEALLNTQVAEVVPSAARGTAMGACATGQALGAFGGAALMGLTLDGNPAIVVVVLGLCLAGLGSFYLFSEQTGDSNT